MSQMPAKIWVHKDTKYNTGEEVYGYQYEFAQEIECEGIENFVEYILKDAFIEKACGYFAPHISDNSGGYDRARIIEDFKKYMEG